VEDAIPYFTAQININQNDWDAYLRRAEAEDAQNQREVAIADYTAAIKLHPGGGKKIQTAAPSATLHDWTRTGGKVSTRRRLQFFQDQEELGGRPQRRSCLVPGPITSILPTISKVLPYSPIYPVRSLPKGQGCWC